MSIHVSLFGNHFLNWIESGTIVAHSDINQRIRQSNHHEIYFKFRLKRLRHLISGDSAVLRAFSLTAVFSRVKNTEKIFL